MVLMIADQNVALLLSFMGELDILSVAGKDVSFLEQKSDGADYRLLDLGPGWGSNFCHLI